MAVGQNGSRRDGTNPLDQEMSITVSHSSNVSGVVHLWIWCFYSACTNSSKKVSPFVKPKLSTGSPLTEEENLVKRTHTKESVSLSTTQWALTETTEFFSYPSLTATPKSRVKKSCVLTNTEGIAMLKKKEKEKKRCRQRNIYRKKEHGEKKQQREKENVQKAEERT